MNEEDRAWFVGAFVEVGLLLAGALVTVLDDEAKTGELSKRLDRLTYKTERLREGIRSVSDRERFVKLWE